MITNDDVVEMRRQREKLLTRTTRIWELLTKASPGVPDEASNRLLQSLDSAASQMEGIIKLMEEEVEEEP